MPAVLSCRHRIAHITLFMFHELSHMVLYNFWRCLDMESSWEVISLATILLLWEKGRNPVGWIANSLCHRGRPDSHSGCCLQFWLFRTPQPYHVVSIQVVMCLSSQSPNLTSLAGLGTCLSC